MAYFHNASDAEKAARDLRDYGLAQIGVAAKDFKTAQKSAQKIGATPGLAASPHAGAELDQAFGESLYASTESLRGALAPAGLTQKSSDYFESQLHRGGLLLTVQVPPERKAEAARILERHHADVGEHQESAPVAEAPAAFDAGKETIRLHGELLRVHKQRVQRGEVRLRKEVVTERHRMEVPVSREDLVIERTQAASGQEEPLSGKQEIRVPLSEEQVRVEKTPVVTEEVRVGKRQTGGTAPIDETVQRESLEIEDEGLTPEEREQLRRERDRAA